MSKFQVPTREEVSANNQEIFDALKGKLSFVPNIYAYLAKSETALDDFLALQNRKTSLSNKEKEVVNLVVSQLNGCRYCQSAHTVISKMNGFSEEDVLNIRQGQDIDDAKLNALAQFTLSASENRGRVSEEAKNAFFAAGFTEANLIDVIIVIGDITITNYIHNIAGFAIDFPLAVELEAVEA